MKEAINLQKRFIATAVGASAVVGYMLRNKESREKVKGAVGSVMNMIGGQQNNYSTLEKAGVPDQLENTYNSEQEHLDNVKMMSEGSTYGVHYYNEEVLEKETLQ